MIWAPGSDRRVVVTGIGPVTSVGIGVRPFWDSLVAGRSGIGPIESFDPSDLPVRIAGEIRDFAPEDWMSPKEARRSERFAQFALAASQLAWEDAGSPQFEPPRAGAIIATGNGGLLVMLREYRVMLEQGWRKINPLCIPMLMPNAAVGAVGIKFGFMGPNICITTACAASTNALGEAYRYIKEGAADVVIAGGTEANLHPMAIMAFSMIGALSRHPDPERASRPFDRDRDGFVMAEGAAALVLEEAERAIARGVRIYAEISGYGLSSDGYNVAEPDPDGTGPAHAIQMCLDSAGEVPEAVDYINAHGTSMPAYDLAETRAIKKVFGDHAYRVPVSSTKSMTGHPLGSAGALEAAVCALAVQEGTIPPNINLGTPDEECDLDYVSTAARRADVRLALSNSFALGGHNAVLALRRWES